ncbi:MAG: endonuclease/exonuclease/phosphatase family protein [Saprospiraceae bacterium]|nr:endonuclease/exonuclease/phosphatase family protein [Saprospiraceae bacterium]
MVFIIVSIGTHLSAQHELNIMSFNIRLDNTDDGVNAWTHRKDKVADIITFYDTDICGMQEVLYNQIEDLKSLLSDWDYVGVGRDDGKKGGEFSPIFYNSKKFRIKNSGTFWLSESPGIPSKSWDAALNRIVSWAHFEAGRKMPEFFVFNTHFDHKGGIARKESADIVVRKVKEIAGSLPAIIMGDMNARPEDLPIKILTTYFSDARTLCQSKVFGPESTFNGFGPSEIEGMRIDYIFLHTSEIQVKKFATFSHTWNGLFASDHHPVFAKLVIR